MQIVLCNVNLNRNNYNKCTAILQVFSVNGQTCLMHRIGHNITTLMHKDYETRGRKKYNYYILLVARETFRKIKTLSRQECTTNIEKRDGVVGNNFVQ